MADDEETAHMRMYRFPAASPATTRNDSGSDHDELTPIGVTTPVMETGHAQPSAQAPSTATGAVTATPMAGRPPVPSLASHDLSGLVLPMEAPSRQPQVTEAPVIQRGKSNNNNNSNTGSNTGPARRGVSFALPANQVAPHDNVRRIVTSTATPPTAAAATDPTTAATAAANARRPAGDAVTTGAENTDGAEGGGGGSYVVVDGPRRRRRHSSSTADTPEHAFGAASSPGARGRRGSGGATGDDSTSVQRNRSGVSFLVDLVTPEAGPHATYGHSQPNELQDGEVNAETPMLGRANSISGGGGRPRRGRRAPRGGDADTLAEDEDGNRDMTMEDVVKAGPAPYTAAAKVAEEGSGSHRIGTQLLALVERTMRQYWRNKVGFLAELIVPLIFIVLVIVLDVAFGSESLKEKNPLGGTQLAFQANSADYLSYLCYNDIAGYPPLGDLMPCSDTEGKYNCAGDENGLPVKGFCYITVFSSAASVVAQYVEALAGPLIAVPPLDSIIAHQWMAKKAKLASDSRTRTALAALSSVGLGVSSSTRYDSITYSGNLLFAPRDKVPFDLLSFFESRSQFFRYVNGGIFDTVEEARDYVKSSGGNLESNTSIWGLVVVNDLTENFDVEIQLHDKAIPALYPTVTMSYRTGYNFDGSDMYLASGFATLQTTLYDYFITAKQNSLTILPLYDPDVAYPMVASLPTIAGERRYLVDLAGPLIAFIIVLAFLYPFSQMTKRVVLEKELRIREAMLIMGLRRTSLWLCYFIVSFMQLLLTCILITILLCATVVKRSNPFDVFLMLLVFACTLIPLVGLVSTFFSKARLAALLSPLLYFVLSMFIFSMTNAKQSMVLGLSIFSPTALAALMSSVMVGEGGSGFGTGDLRGNPHYRPEPYKVMLMLMGDFFIYTLLMLYLDAVVPQEWGSTRHPLFFILDPYRALRKRCTGETRRARRARSHDGEEGEGEVEAWRQRDGREAVPLQQVGEGSTRGSGSSGQDGAYSNDAGRQQQQKKEGMGSDPTRFDPATAIDPSTGERKPVSIRLDSLVKRYKRSGKTFTAVDHVSWNLHPGEISVLLGPNGSGKSTTINMMTGMLPADEGDCELGGFSIRDRVGEARHQLGFCPQHNILWPDLTCREHLEFFGKIKGLRGAELEDAVTDVLRAVDLAEKIDHTPPMLSGGQKRKLSVAIAFVGRNRLVLLDEPTSGMDVAARRHTWSLLRAMAPNHTILLTTHYMDEADLLGDHIAIVSEGVMQCAGSSLFLRAHAGSGYTLRFDLLPLPPSAAASFAGTRASQLNQKWNTVSRSVLTHVPEACMTLQTDAEMAFTIPLSCERQLPELLGELERRGNRQMGIRSYALSAPTLEDVFLNIIEAAHARKASVTEPRGSSSTIPGVAADDKLITPLRSATPSHVLSDEMTTTTTTILSPDRAANGGAGRPHSQRRSTAQPSSPGVKSNPLLFRRMSRASMRFLTGDKDAAAAAANAATANANTNANATGDDGVFQDAIVFREPDEDTTDTSNEADSSDEGHGGYDDARSGEVMGGARTKAAATAWGAGPDGFEDDIFGARIDSPTAGEAATPWVRKGSKALQEKRRVSIQVPATGGGSQSREEREGESEKGRGSGGGNSGAAGGEAQSRPSAVKGSSRAAHHRDSMMSVTGDTTASGGGGGEAPGGIRQTWSDVSAAGQPDPASTEDVKRLAARADQNLEGVWRVQPVKSARAMWSLQFEAMLFKRFWYSLRDRRMQFFQIICPVICILLAMLLQLVNVQYTNLLEFEAAPLFQSATEVHTSRCTGMFGSEMVVETIFPPTGKDAVTFVDKNFAFGSELCDYMLDTWYTHPEPRYAAVQCVDPSLTTLLQVSYPTTLAGRVPFTMFYNSSSHQSLPYVMGTVYQLLYYSAMSRSGFSLEAIQQSRFRIGVKPLPINESARKSDNALASILIGVIVLIPFTFLPANPVAWVVKEREVRARHLQKLSGLPYLLYWAGNMVFDFLAYIISMLLVIVVFAIFQRWEYVGGDAIGATFVSFILYGLCCCTGSYAVSFLFSEHTTAQVVVMGVSFLTGFVCVVLVFILSMLDWTKEASDILRWIFRVLPTYSVGEVILSLALLEQSKLKEPGLTPWSMRVTGWADVYMACEVPVFALITLLWDHPNRSAVLQRIKDGCCCACGKGRRRSSSEQDETDVNHQIPNSSHTPQVSPAPAPHHSSNQIPASPPTTHEPSEDPTGPAAAAIAAGHRRESHSPVTPAHGGSGAELRARQLRAAAAEERCRHDTLLRRQSMRLLPLTEEAAAADRSAFEPTEGAGAVAGMPSGPPYGTPGSVVFSPAPPPGAHAAATEGQRARKVGIPSLAVDDLTQRRGPPEDGVKLAAGCEGKEDGEEVITPGYVVSVPVESTRAHRRASLTNAVVAAAAAAAHGTSASPAAPAPSSGAAYMYPASAWDAEDDLAKEEEDSDVEDERIAVYQDEKALSATDVVRLVDLRKVYANGKVAVRSLSFGVMPGEVFGFLGTNGAGKSTAISILTQEQLPTNGRAYVCGHDVVRDSNRAMRCIGYCPQFDACFDLLTVQEHLHFYARIRGIERTKRRDLVSQLMELCDLTTYQDVLSRELSGGNRRKLSVAIALLGAPRVICLDEPSAGMDPIARRMLWRALDRVSHKCSIVLTTHHLEEVEALADTVAIMVDGGLRCIGDLPHLKHKYARNAYELCIRVGGTGGAPVGGVRSTPAAGGGAKRPEEDVDPLGRSTRALSFAGRREVSTASAVSVDVFPGNHEASTGREDRETSVSISVATPSSQARRLRGRAQSITYAGADFIDTDNDVVQFMAAHLPSAVLVENFNDERYVYSIPATRDVAVAMALLQENLQRRRSSAGTLLGTSFSRSAMSPLAGASASISARARTAAAAAAAKIVRLSDVFRLLQEHQARLGITEYSVSQVSLEQVFLRVANHEGHDEGAKRHKAPKQPASEPRRAEAKDDVRTNATLVSAVTPSGGAKAGAGAGAGAGAAASPAPRRPSVSLSLASFDPAASSAAAASPAMHGGNNNINSTSVNAARAVGPYQRANSLYRVLSIHRRASAAAALQSHRDKTRASGNSASSHYEKSFYTPSAGPGASGVYGAYAMFRRARARQRCRAAERESARQQLSEPDHLSL